MSGAHDLLMYNVPALTVESLTVFYKTATEVPDLRGTLSNTLFLKPYIRRCTGSLICITIIINKLDNSLFRITPTRVIKIMPFSQVDAYA